MPAITFLQAGVEQWVAARTIPQRSNGLHVSALVVKMLQAFAPDKFAHYGRAGDGDRAGAFELGYAWEDVLAKALAERAVDLLPMMEPAELARDSIFGTPDRILWDAAGNRFIDEELKVTWFSAAKIVDNPAAILSDRRFLYWILQGKTYAAMLTQYEALQILDSPGRSRWLAVPLSRRAPLAPPLTRIHALFVNGTYTFSEDNRARVLSWEITWTPAELDAWWATCLRHAAKPDQENSHE